MEEVRVSRLPQLNMGLLSSAPAANRVFNGSKDKRESFVPIWAINSPKFSVLKATGCDS